MPFQRVICCALAILGWCSLQAGAQTAYPNKPIRVVVPFAAGGGNDTLGRLVAQRLTEAFKQQAYVDNRGGAAGRVGAEHVAKSPADGYTLMIGGSSVMITAPALYKSLAYDMQKDFAPITLVGSNAYVLLVHPSVPASSVKEFIALCRARPGALNYASSGPGGPAHLAGELFQSLAGVRILHVPYKGSAPALLGVIGGETDLTFNNIQPSAPVIQSGRLRAIAVTSLQRSPILPAIPTFAEAGLPGFEVAIFYGVLAPAATPADIIARLNDVLVKGLNTADTRKRLGADGTEPLTSTPDEFARLIRSETEKWAKLIKAAGIRPE